MKNQELSDSEYRLCLIVWDQEPVNSTQLVGLAREQLGWAKATTYTVLRKLCQRGLLQNENATVTSRITKAQAQQHRMDRMLQDTFEGSLPAFLAAFSRSRKLSDREAQRLLNMIDSFGEE